MLEMVTRILIVGVMGMTLMMIHLVLAQARSRKRQAEEEWRA